MKVNRYVAYKKGSLGGFFELSLPSGLTIRGMTYHSQNDKRWVGFSSKPDENNGETKYLNILHIPDDARWREFQSLALAALDEYLANNRQNTEDDVPF
jgi:hypothetical protein